MSPQEKSKAIEDILARKKAAAEKEKSGPIKATAPTTATKKKVTREFRTDDASPTPPPAPEPKATDDLLTVGDVCRELNIDPKTARRKLRASGREKVEGHWPKVRRDSKEHKELVAVIKPTEDE